VVELDGAGVSTETRNSIDVWHEFAAAIDFVTEFENPNLSLWGALADALASWADLTSVQEVAGVDPLRSVLRELLDSTPEAGAPGGIQLGAVIEAAIVDWAQGISARLNDGYTFTS
jgi:hypothetical protein